MSEGGNVEQPEDLSASQALTVIRELASESRGVFVIRHGEGRRKKRGVSNEDIQRVLLRGRVTEGPYIAIKSGNWRLNVTGRSAGEELTCVVEIEWRECVLVVTVFKA
jgi:hypothetical protein